MGPGGIGSGVLAGAVAFTCLVTVFILVITYIGYSSSVMGTGAKRLVIAIVVIVFVYFVVVAGLILFPSALKTVYYFINRLGYR